MQAIGETRWAIPEGYLPEWSHGPEPELTSHGTFSVLNTGDEPAELKVTVFFTDREPAGPYLVAVPPRRTKHVRFNQLDDPEPIPRGQDFGTLIESSVPVVVQHTRLDSRQNENALMTTLAYAG